MKSFKIFEKVQIFHFQTSVHKVLFSISKFQKFNFILKVNKLKFSIFTQKHLRVKDLSLAYRCAIENKNFLGQGQGHRQGHQGHRGQKPNFLLRF